MCGAVVFVLALTTALGYSVFSFHPFGPDSAWLDLWDFILSNNLLPLGGLVIAMFCCSKAGWGWDKLMAEANEGQGMKVRPWMRWIFGLFVPVAVLVIWLMGLLNFNWG